MLSKCFILIYMRSSLLHFKRYDINVTLLQRKCQHTFCCKIQLLINSRILVYYKWALGIFSRISLECALKIFFDLNANFNGNLLNRCSRSIGTLMSRSALDWDKLIIGFSTTNCIGSKISTVILCKKKLVFHLRVTSYLSPYIFFWPDAVKFQSRKRYRSFSNIHENSFFI